MGRRWLLPGRLLPTTSRSRTCAWDSGQCRRARPRSHRSSEDAGSDREYVGESQDARAGDGRGGDPVLLCLHLSARGAVEASQGAGQEVVRPMRRSRAGSLQTCSCSLVPGFEALDRQLTVGQEVVHLFLFHLERCPVPRPHE